MRAALSKILLAGLDALYFTRSYRIAPAFVAGVGVILTFHHVRPPRSDAFQPNRNLEISPDFLERLIGGILASTDEIVSLDEAHRRLREGDFSRRFVVLTFDDGYRDTREYAFPILKRFGVPFTLFVASSFADGTGDLWWVALERAIAANTSLQVNLDGKMRRFDCRTDARRQTAFQTIYWSLRGLDNECELRRRIHELAANAEVDTRTICSSLCMGWGEIAELANDPLVTIGGHTDTHIMLAKTSAERARDDIVAGATRIEQRLGLRPSHLSFPLGDRTSAGPREFEIAEQLSFKTAVTTRRGVLYPRHRDHLTALPRISVNGRFQQSRYMELLLSGVPTSLANRFRQIDAN